MAASKTSVQINRFAVKGVFDAKHKSRLPALMQKAAEKAVKGSGKLTLEAPRERARPPSASTAAYRPSSRAR